jgi:diguanylate cyclase (GGDEF)-like protein
MKLVALRRFTSRYLLSHPLSWLNSTMLGGLMVALVWACIVGKHIENRSIDSESAKRELQNFALLFEENVLRSIGEMDKALLYLRRAIESSNQPVDFGRIANTTDILSELIVQVAIIDADGIMRASNAGPQPAPPINLSDREHFRYHAGKKSDDVFISKPVVGRASGKWSVQLTRRFLQPSGEFGGVVVASFDPDHFRKFSDRIDLGMGATFALIGADGIVRAANGDRSSGFALGMDLSGSGLMNSVTAGSVDPAWHLTEGGVSRLIVLRKVAGHPMSVSVSMLEAVIFTDSVNHLRLMLFAGILLSLLIATTARRARLLEMQSKYKTRQLELTLEHMSQGIMMVTKDLEIPIINRKCIKLLDLPVSFLKAPPRFDELIAYQVERGEFTEMNLPDGLGPLDVFGPKDATGRFGSYERVRPDGGVIEVRSVRLRDGSFVRTFSDITQRRKAQKLADRLAAEDALTGLANRRTLNQSLTHLLDQQVEGEERHARSLAVLYLDLDRFKLVNDTRGHAVGDKLLQAVAQRLKECVRTDDQVGRLGGDEFAVILASGDQEGRPEVVAKRLVEALSRPYEINGQQLLVGVSIGIALAPGDAQTADNLLIAADLALYSAKAAGRGTYRFFAKDMNEGVKVRQQIETDLRLALERKELELHYQPIINLRENVIVGFEALARWRHPVQGMIPPDKFIPIAEEGGLIEVLGQWVLREACREAVSWPEALTVAVNLSPLQFANPRLATMIEMILIESGLPPSRLEVEITEGLLMRNTENNMAILKRLKEIGVRIAMDDFGTGYSSLAYLQSFPFDRIKVDRSFVSKLGSSDSSLAIVRAIVDIAVSSGMHTTAEGVETEDQQLKLSSLGCDEAQGYLFSRPLPRGDVASVIANWKPPARIAA